jgi:predicted RNA methylase
MSYSDVTGHHSMVFDALRNAAYVRAMRQAIEPGATVMDLGAGLGVHGLSAAMLGAAQVHLVEPAPVLEVARQVAKDNGLDNVHCHNCRAEELELDGKVDVLVSVFTGNFLLTEDLLPSLFHARDRFLAPDGKMIPDCGRMEVVPVSAPDYYREYVDQWSAYPEQAERHGMPPLDYKAVRPFAANTLFYDKRERFDATPLAVPVTLMELDFHTATKADCDSQVEATIERDGICHGWLGWFQMRLGDKWLSTSGEPESTHWSPVFLPLEKPIQLQAGEHIKFALKRPEQGEWTWTTEHAGQRQRQSTFLSQPLSPERLRKASEHYQPKLNQRGESARWLLAQMAGEATVSQLAEQVQARFPGAFSSGPEALKFVKHLAGRFS